FRRLGLLLDPQRVVELVKEAAQRDAEGQFDDLRLAEMPPEASEQLVRDAVGALPGGDRIFDDELVGIVELRMIAVIEETVGASAIKVIWVAVVTRATPSASSSATLG